MNRGVLGRWYRRGRSDPDAAAGERHLPGVPDQREYHGPEGPDDLAWSLPDGGLPGPHRRPPQARHAVRGCRRRGLLGAGGTSQGPYDPEGGRI